VRINYFDINLKEPIIFFSLFLCEHRGAERGDGGGGGGQPRPRLHHPRQGHQQHRLVHHVGPGHRGSLLSTEKET
jgi:hypothetical protein